MRIYNKTFLKSLIYDEKTHRNLRKNYQKIINVNIDKDVQIDATNYFENTAGKFKNIAKNLVKKLLECAEKHEDYLDYKFNYVSPGGQSFYFIKADELIRISTHWTELNIENVASCFWNLKYKKDTEIYGSCGGSPFFGGKINFSKLLKIKNAIWKTTYIK